MKQRIYTDVKVNIKTKDIQKKSVIYCLTFPNGKVYIGKTSGDLEKRIRLHCWTSYDTKDKSYNTKKARAIRKYQEFSVSILYEGDDLNEKEVEFIAKYNSKNNGYNTTDGGEGNKGWKPSPETIQKKRDTAKNKKVIYQYDLDGNYLNEFSSVHIANDIVTGTLHGYKNISACALGNKKTAYKYKWSYEKVDKLPQND